MSGKRGVVSWMFIIAMAAILATNNLITFIDFYSKYDVLVIAVVVVMVAMTVINLDVVQKIGG
jgi:uncharacterized membrane protein YoaT (DUF817 family)